MRLDKYTPAAANETKSWIEDILGERLPGGDLLDGVKDGVALCKLINLAVGAPGVKYKASAMPFVQMENISHFLRACQSPPLNLQPHDVFLTVDLYEQKDPAQVLQCISAFSRVAHQVAPSRFPSAIGQKSRGFVSPQVTGSSSTVGGGSYGNRGGSMASSSTSGSTTFNPVKKLTPTATGSSNGGRWSPTKSGTPKSPGGVSSWSKKGDEGATSPAWNIAQYGYMGGASQGNMGISFGGRRQITSAGPYVPNLAEKEKRRREEQAGKERLEEEQKKAEEQRRLEIQAEEERARIAEEERWAEETRKAKEKARLQAEAERRKWEEEERQWRLDEERRQNEERDAAAQLEKETRRVRGNSDARLKGQFLSQYQAEQGLSCDNTYGTDHSRATDHSRGSSRIEELERELEKARERERQYECERQERRNGRDQRSVEEPDTPRRTREVSKSRARSRSRARPQPDSDEAWRKDEREYLRNKWAKEQHDGALSPTRPEYEPTRVVKNNTGSSSRPLPDPANYTSPKVRQAKSTHFAADSPGRPVVSEAPKFTSPTQNRTDRYLSSNAPPQSPRPKTTYSNEIGGFDSTAERDAEDRRRTAAQAKTKAGGWASKSLLEREMEMERQRQKEWEEAQKAVQRTPKTGDGVDGIGGGIGGKWDVNQWTGYTGGDGQNKGSQGIGSGRRQIVGPRPPPSK